MITVTRQNSLRPLSTLGDIVDPTSQGFDSRYDALQINYTKRFSLGFDTVTKKTLRVQIHA